MSRFSERVQRHVQNWLGVWVKAGWRRWFDRWRRRNIECLGIRNVVMLVFLDNCLPLNSVVRLVCFLIVCLTLILIISFVVNFDFLGLIKLLFRDKVVRLIWTVHSLISLITNIVTIRILRFSLVTNFMFFLVFSNLLSSNLIDHGHNSVYFRMVLFISLWLSALTSFIHDLLLQVSLHFNIILVGHFSFLNTKALILIWFLNIGCW